jgi:hypothetical protein
MSRGCFSEPVNVKTALLRDVAGEDVGQKGFRESLPVVDDLASAWRPSRDLWLSIRQSSCTFRHPNRNVVTNHLAED